MHALCVAALYGGSGVELRDRRGVTSSVAPASVRDAPHRSPLVHNKLPSLQMTSSGSEDSVLSLDKNSVVFDVGAELRLVIVVVVVVVFCRNKLYVSDQH